MNNEWYLCNDAKITRLQSVDDIGKVSVSTQPKKRGKKPVKKAKVIDENSFNSGTAYLLFYRQVD